MHQQDACQTGSSVFRPDIISKSRGNNHINAALSLFLWDLAIEIELICRCPCCKIRTNLGGSCWKSFTSLLISICFIDAKQMSRGAGVLKRMEIDFGAVHSATLIFGYTILSYL